MLQDKNTICRNRFITRIKDWKDSFLGISLFSNRDEYIIAPTVKKQFIIFIDSISIVWYWLPRAASDDICKPGEREGQDMGLPKRASVFAIFVAISCFHMTSSYQLLSNFPADELSSICSHEVRHANLPPLQDPPVTLQLSASSYQAGSNNVVRGKSKSRLNYLKIEFNISKC